MRRTIILFGGLALGIFLSFGCSGGGGGGGGGMQNNESDSKLQTEAVTLKKKGAPCFDAASCEEGLLCIANICQQYVEPVVVPPVAPPDETVPTITVQCPEAALSNKNSGEITLSSDVDADIFCAIDDAVMGKCSSPFKYSDLADGPHVFRAYALGTNQKVSETVECQWATDVTKPYVMKMSVADGSFVPSTTKNFIFEFSEPVAQSGNVKLKMNWSDIAGGGALSEDAMQYNFIPRGAGLADGDYVMTISGFKDDAGNIMDEDSVSFIVDDIMPAVQISCPPKTLTNVSSGGIAFSSKENVQFSCKLDGGAEKACISPFSYANLPDGKHTFELFAVAETQKKTSGGSCFWAIDATPPKVVSLDPANGSVVNITTQSFKIGFSEPVAQSGTVSITSSGYSAPGSCTLSTDKTSCTFVTGGELKFGDYTISIKGFKDEAGNQMPDQAGNFTAKFIPNPVIPNGAWKANLAAGVHPRVFGNKARLLELKAKKPALFDRLQKSVATFDPNMEWNYYYWILLNPNILPTDAVVYATTGRSVYTSKIREIIMRIITDPVYNTIDPNTKMNPFNDHESTYMKMMDVAIAYDIYRDVFSDAERNMMIEYLNKHLGVYILDESPFSSSNLNYKTYAYLLAAYATWNENPKAKDLRDYAVNKMYEGKLLPVLQYVGEGGAGGGEGGWYDRSFMPKLMENLELLRLFEGYDGFEKAPNFFYSKLAYEMNDTYPEQIDIGGGIWDRYPEEGDGDLWYGGANNSPVITRTFLAEYYRGTELARQVISNKNAFLTTEQVLKQEPPVALFFYLFSNGAAEDPISISQMPLAHLAKGEGRIYARSSWADDASFLRFECGPYFAQHQHLEVGNFEIYRNGHLATESGSYGFGGGMGSSHWVNWYARTIAHNSILVFDPNEFMKDDTYYKNLADGGQNRIPNGQWSFYGNEGGQSIKRNIWIDTMDGWLAKKGFLAPPITFYDFRGGTIVGYENMPQYMFAACDGTAAYEPDKMAKWVREIVFLRPHTFVIFDRVVSTKAEFPKTWLVHSVNQPTMNATERTFTIKKDNGALYGKALLPEKAVVMSKNGYGYDNKEFPLVTVVPSYYVVGKWRIEVKPSEAKTEDLFLHVLSTEGAPNAKLITGTPAGTIGVNVNGTEVYFTNDVGGKVKIGATTYPLEAKVKKNKYE